MDPNDENDVRILAGFSNPTTATATMRPTALGTKKPQTLRVLGGGQAGRRPLGDLTQSSRNQPFKVHPGVEKIAQKSSNERLPLKAVQQQQRLRLSSRQKSSAQFVIHQDKENDNNKENDSSQFRIFPSPSKNDLSSCSNSSYGGISVTEFRQNVSISSVSTDDDDENDNNRDLIYNDDLEAMDSSEQTSGAGDNDGANEQQLVEGGFGDLDENGELVVCQQRRLEAVGESVLASEDYSSDILLYSKQSEIKCLPKWNYMTKQSDITFPMRAILVDWLVEVSEEYNVGTETLYLAVYYIDRFLSFMSVQRAKLQLVGTSSMFIAAKYEEIYPPELSEFVYITDDTYSTRQILKMEQLILGVLGFSVSVPTAFYFVNHFCQISECNAKTLSLAQYLSELTLVDGETYLCYLPSVIGSSAVALARHTLGYAAWDANMIRISGYSIDDFKVCLVQMHKTFSNARQSPQQSIIEKYKQSKHHGVSNVEPTSIF